MSLILWDWSANFLKAKLCLVNCLSLNCFNRRLTKPLIICKKKRSRIIGRFGERRLPFGAHHCMMFSNMLRSSTAQTFETQAFFVCRNAFQRIPNDFRMLSYDYHTMIAWCRMAINGDYQNNRCQYNWSLWLEVSLMKCVHTEKARTSRTHQNFEFLICYPRLFWLLDTQRWVDFLIRWLKIELSRLVWLLSQESWQSNLSSWFGVAAFAHF